MIKSFKYVQIKVNKDQQNYYAKAENKKKLVEKYIRVNNEFYKTEQDKLNKLINGVKEQKNENEKLQKKLKLLALELSNEDYSEVEKIEIIEEILQSCCNNYSNKTTYKQLAEAIKTLGYKSNQESLQLIYCNDNTEDDNEILGVNHFVCVSSKIYAPINHV